MTFICRSVYNKNSEILILGSFPSVKSREQQFFYGHPQNRFWKVISSVFNEECPALVEEKKAFLLRNKIAVWDVIKTCDIVGSSDISIRNVVVNPIDDLIAYSNINRIFTNGNASFDYYNKYVLPVTGIIATKLPSTSPANAAWSLDKLIETWSVMILSTAGTNIF